MSRTRIICSVIVLLLVSNLSLAGQMLMLPAAIESEMTLSSPPCHQIDQSAEVQNELPCCVDDCSSCLTSSIVSSELNWFANFDPDINNKSYSSTMSGRDVAVLYRPPISA